MSKAVPRIHREILFLFVLLPISLFLSGCSKRTLTKTNKNLTAELIQKTLNGVTMKIVHLASPKNLGKYQQLRVTITNTTNTSLRLAGNHITLPLTSVGTMKQQAARGFKTRYLVPNGLLCAAGLVFLWPLCLVSIATTGISYQFSTVSDERKIAKQGRLGLQHEDIIEIKPKSTHIADLFIRSAYIPTFAITIWQGNKPLVFLTRSPL